MVSDHVSGAPMYAYAPLKGSGKDAWHDNPANHVTLEIPPPPPKKSCLDKARNALARTAAQIRTGHWRSSEYLKRIKKQPDDKCWFCINNRMSRSRVLLHCPHARLAAARVEAWEGRDPEVSVCFYPIPGGSGALELSGAGRVMADGTGEDQARAARMDN